MKANLNLPTRLRICVSLAAGLCLAASANAGTVYHFKMHKVIDSNGTGMLAGTYLVPTGWTAKDQITWMPSNYGTPAVGRSTTTSPDGTMILDRVSAISVNYGQSTLARNGMPPPSSIAELLAQLWAKDHPGVQYQIVSKDESPIDRHMGQFLTYGYDGSVKLAFEKDGRRMIVKGYARIDGYQTQSYGGAAVSEGQWTLSNLMAVTAPEEKFAPTMKLLAISLSSYQIDPRFFNLLLQVQKLAMQRAYNASENALALSRHIAGTQSQISADIMSVYQNREKAMDNMNEKFDDYIRGEETYTDGNTKVKLPNWHSHLYSDGDGDYYYSDKTGGASGNFHEIHSGG